MATTVTRGNAVELQTRVPHSPNSAKPTNTSTLLTDLLRDPPRPATACPLFPTESEDYYCLSCYTRCSGLALLVGPHTSHDYLPLTDALLYLPAALLRETQEVVRESEESFAKPWRLQDQQRNDHLTYLMQQRESKVAALRQLMAEVADVEGQLLRATEAKALALSNWRYQQRNLRRKVEKLACGAETLAASLQASHTYGEDSSGRALGEHEGNQATEAVSAAARSSTQTAPSWQHSQQTARSELAQVQRLLSRQLQQLAEDEAAAQRQLETWHRLLNTVAPHGGPHPAYHLDARMDYQAAQASTTFAPAHPTREQTAPFRESPSFSHTATPSAGVKDAPLANSPPSPPPTAPPRFTSAVGDDFTDHSSADRDAVHPSNAEVALLQHALLNINDGLRHRLLRAAAASLTSSSAASSQSRLPSSSSRDGTQTSYAPYTPVCRTADTTTGETVHSSLPPLPDETPLRDKQTTASRTIYDQREKDDGRRRPADPPSPPPRQFTRVAATASGMVYTPAEAPKSHQCGLNYIKNNNYVNDEQDETQVRGARWRSWHAQEQALKDSLNQLLEGASATQPVGTTQSI